MHVPDVVPELDATTLRRALEAVRVGDPAGLNELFDSLYPELRALAHRRSEGAGETLGTTGLVHELYLKFSGSGGIEPRDRAHFLAVASRAMRQIVIDQARRRMARKRRPPEPHANPVAFPPVPDRAAELVALDRALAKLERQDVRAAQTVELRYFGGLSVEETAEALGVSMRTVKRDWRWARAFLHDAVAPPPA